MSETMTSGQEVLSRDACVHRRGLIVNLSADSLFDPGGLPFPVEDFEDREKIVEGYGKLIDRYAGTQVSDLFLNANYQRTCFPSRTWTSFWDCDDPDSQVAEWPRQAWLAHRAGVDPFEVCIGSCRAQGISPWISMRMNDWHYLDDPCKEPVEPLPARVSAENAVSFSIHIGPCPSTGTVLVRVGLDESRSGETKPPVEVRVNGAECLYVSDLTGEADASPSASTEKGIVWEVSKVAPHVVQFEAPLTALASGYNRVDISLARGRPQRVVWLEIFIEETQHPDGSETE